MSIRTVDKLMVVAMTTKCMWMSGGPDTKWVKKWNLRTIRSFIVKMLGLYYLACFPNCWVVGFFSCIGIVLAETHNNRLHILNMRDWRERVRAHKKEGNKPSNVHLQKFKVIIVHVLPICQARMQMQIDCYIFPI